MGSRQEALDAAFLDADFAAWYLHGHPQLELKLVPEFVPRERWNMALAVRANDTAASHRGQPGPRPARRDGGTEEGSMLTPPCRFVLHSPAIESCRRRLRIPGSAFVHRGELVVSIDPANLPYSAAKG